MTRCRRGPGQRHDTALHAGRLKRRLADRDQASACVGHLQRHRARGSSRAAGVDSTHANPIRPRRHLGPHERCLGWAEGEGRHVGEALVGADLDEVARRHPNRRRVPREHDGRAVSIEPRGAGSAEQRLGGPRSAEVGDGRRGLAERQSVIVQRRRARPLAAVGHRWIREVQYARASGRAVVGHHGPERLVRVLVAVRIGKCRDRVGILRRVRRAHVVGELVAEGVVGGDAGIGRHAEGVGRECQRNGLHHPCNSACPSRHRAGDERDEIGANGAAPRVHLIDEPVRLRGEALQVGREVTALAIANQLGAHEPKSLGEAAVDERRIRFGHAQSNASLDRQIIATGLLTGGSGVHDEQVDLALIIVGAHHQIGAAPSGHWRHERRKLRRRRAGIDRAQDVVGPVAQGLQRKRSRRGADGSLYHASHAHEGGRAQRLTIDGAGPGPRSISLDLGALSPSRQRTARRELEHEAFVRQAIGCDTDDTRPGTISETGIPLARRRGAGGREQMANRIGGLRASGRFPRRCQQNHTREHPATSQA